jgi:trans-2,3-dihydro-3-hydroxyanthranilate isomerase
VRENCSSAVRSLILPVVEIPFRLVDVFTDRPLAGNQLCVVPQVVEGLDTVGMQAVAKEIGFSETTFVTEAAGDRYAMRIFTPDAELPFAGHPTLGTAFVLVAEGLISSPATQVVAAGEFRVEVELEKESARVLQGPPSFAAEVRGREAMARAVGLEESDLHPDLMPQVVSTGLPHLMTPAASVDAVVRARPTAEVRDVLEGVGALALYLFAVTGDGQAKARSLTSPSIGISEDPATGSAAGPLGAYLARHGLAGLPGKLLIHQGEEIGRPSELHVDVRANGDSFDVWVEGGVVIVGRGVFEL